MQEELTLSLSSKNCSTHWSRGTVGSRLHIEVFFFYSRHSIASFLDMLATTECLFPESANECVDAGIFGKVTGQQVEGRTGGSYSSRVYY